MLDGLPLVDAHVHAARLPTVKVGREQWAPFPLPIDDLYDPAGTLRPDRYDAYLEREGVDVALLFAEYSPRVTGLQPIEDLLPLAAHNPRRFRLVANLNPHYHYPLLDEFERQRALGAIALKVHPVHAGFPLNDRSMYPVYAACQDIGMPVIVHCGTSTFPGSVNAFGDPVQVDDVVRDFPRLTVVLAHGGRGWWYAAAAFLALAHPTVWIEIGGLPPRRLAEYYRGYDLRRLAQRFIFGSDWPGVPGIRANAQAVASLGLGDDVLRAVLAGNACAVYRLSTD